MSIPSANASYSCSLTQPLAGMQRAEAQLARTTAALARGEVTSSRMVDALVSQRMYEANVSVVRTQDRMVGTLLRVLR